MSRRVLALWQPWASLCVLPSPDHGGLPAKKHETRSWVPWQPLPLRVAIHAAKKWTSENNWTIQEEPFRSILRGCGIDLTVKNPLPLGHIIGVATIVSATTTDDNCSLLPPLDRDDEDFGDFGPGRYAWTLTDQRALATPIPHRGRQEALYLLDEATDRAIDDQLAARPTGEEGQQT